VVGSKPSVHLHVDVARGDLRKRSPETALPGERPKFPHRGSDPIGPLAEQRQARREPGIPVFFSGCVAGSLLEKGFEAPRHLAESLAHPAADAFVEAVALAELVAGRGHDTAFLLEAEAEVAEHRVGAAQRDAPPLVRSGVPEGTIFLATGIAVDSANTLTEPTVEVSKR